MKSFLKKIIKKAASPPGTLVHVGEQKTDQVRLNSISYDTDNMNEITQFDIQEIEKIHDLQGITWLNVSGIHEVETIRSVCESYKINPLNQEDILNTLHRPKVEYLDNYIYLVIKMLDYNRDSKEVSKEQVSFILSNNHVITFQEQEGDVFSAVRNRIKTGSGRIRRMGADYLLYALMDAVVDNYFVIMENISEDIEEIEEKLMDNPSQDLLHQIQKLRKELILLKKAVWPLREILKSLVHSESVLIQENSFIYFRDVYDHTIHVVETTETFRDMVAGLQDMYMSSVSNRMNEVMKVLTIIATIFIPLTFIAGIYGMNFEFMPELKWRLGYFIVWGGMIVLGLGMLFYFKRKKWF